MKKPWLLAVVGLLTIVFALGAVACSDDNNDNNGDTTPQATSTTEATQPSDVTPGGSTTPNGTQESTTPAAGSVNVTLNAMGGSGVTGSAVLSEGSAAGSTQVVVTIDGGLTEGEHQNHIHTGTCEAQGNVQDALTPLQASADGSATGTTPAVPEALSSFTGGNNYVAVHATDGTVVACGNIPAA